MGPLGPEATARFVAKTLRTAKILKENTDSGSHRKIIQLKTRQRAEFWPWDEDQPPASSSVCGVFEAGRAQDQGDSTDVARRALWMRKRKGSLLLQVHG